MIITQVVQSQGKRSTRLCIHSKQHLCFCRTQILCFTTCFWYRCFAFDRTCVVWQWRAFQSLALTNSWIHQTKSELPSLQCRGATLRGVTLVGWFHFETILLFVSLCWWHLFPFRLQPIFHNRKHGFLHFVDFVVVRVAYMSMHNILVCTDNRPKSVIIQTNQIYSPPPYRCKNRRSILVPITHPYPALHTRKHNSNHNFTNNPCYRQR